jgi:hypothetical protein
LQQAVAHRPAVDEQVLVGGVASVVGRQAREARQPHAVARLVDLDGVVLEVAAQHGGETGEASLRPRMLGRQAQDPPPVDVQREGDGLVGHGLALISGDRQGLGAFGLHELQAGRRGVEQVAHLDPRAVRAGEGGGGDVAHAAALDQDREGVGLASGAELIDSRATEPIDGRASPRPMVWMRRRSHSPSSSGASLEVAWR